MEELIQKKRVKINFGIFLYTAFTICIVISDYLQYLISANYWLSLGIAAVAVAAGCFLLRKKIQINAIVISKGDIAVILGILFLSALRIAIPANDFDTNNYHLYFQEYLGRDFVNSDFFPIRACNAHCFILGDRMAWIFRKLLGYRLGVIVNTLVLILIYFQAKSIVKAIDRDRERKLGKLVIPVVAIAMFTETLIWNIDTYLIDTFAIPFLLEALRFALLDRDDEVENNTLVWVALMAGCAVSIKMSNVFVLAVLAVFYIVRFRKKIKPLPVVIGASLALFMVGIYMWIGFDITGNPVFPYANGIFKSEYFSLVNSPNDYSAFYARFGPSNFLEYLIWPITVIIHPQKANDMGITAGHLLTFAVIFIIWIVSFILKKTRDKQYLKLLSVWLIFYIFNLTLFQGYSRYVIIMDLLAGILACVALWDWFGKKGVMRVISICLAGVFFVQTGYLAHSYIIKSYEPAWRNTAVADWKTTKQNAKLILKDHHAGVPQHITDDIDVWGVVYYNGSQLAMIKDDVPIIGLDMAVTNEKTQAMSDELREKYKNNNMYTALPAYDVEAGTLMISKLGYEIDRVVLIQPTFIDVSKAMMLLRIKPVDEPKTINAYMLSELEGTVEIPEGASQVKIFVGHEPLAYSWGSDGTLLEISAKNGEKEILMFKDIVTVDGDYITIDLPEELLNGGPIELKWSKPHSEGIDYTGDWVRMIVQYC